MQDQTKKLFENFKMLDPDFNLNEATFTDAFSTGNQQPTTTQPTATKPAAKAPVTPSQPSDVKNLAKRSSVATSVNTAASKINTVNEFSGAFKNWFSSLGYKPDNNAISIGKTVSLIRQAMTELGFK